MANDNGTDQASGQGQEPNQQGQNGGGTDQGSGSGGSGGIDLASLPEDIRGYVEHQVRDAAEARREAAKYRTDLRTAEQKIADAQRQNLPEADRLKAENEALRQRIAETEKAQRDAATAAVVTAEATKQGFVNPSLALRLLDPSELTLDDQGRPTNAKELLAKVAKDEPYLVQRRGAGDAGAGRGGASGPRGGMNGLIREALGRG